MAFTIIAIIYMWGIFLVAVEFILPIVAIFLLLKGYYEWKYAKMRGEQHHWSKVMIIIGWFLVAIYVLLMIGIITF